MSDDELLDEQHPKRQKQQPLPAIPTSRAISFSTLPTDIHLLIFDQLTVEEAFFLALTSQYFWSMGRGHLLRLYASRLGSWAGSCIVNLGEGVRVGDHPLGLVPESWEKTLQQGLDEDEDGYNGGGPASLFDLAESRFDPVSGSVEFPSLYNTFKKLNKDHRISVHLYPGIEALLCPSHSIFYPSDRVWILRNLTTGEFVRSEVFALKPRLAYSTTYTHGPRIEGLGFGEVVLMRCTWSSTSDGTGMPYRREIHRGIWAGHRLDITTLDRLTEGSSNAVTEWKDVSKEVAMEIDEIWSKQFGDWRNAIGGVLEDEMDLAIGEHVAKSRYLAAKMLRSRGCLP